MRVCQLIAPGPMAGAEKVVLEGSAALRRAGAEVTLAVISEERNPGPAAQFSEAAKLRRLRTALFPARGRLDVEPVRALRRFFNLASFDVLHVHGYKAVIYGLFARSARQLLVATHHGETARTAALKAYVKLALLAYRRLDRVIAVSEVTRQSLVDRGVPADRVAVLQNLLPLLESVPSPSAEIPLPQGGVARSAGVGNGTIELLFLGRLSPEKGLDVMLDALARLPRDSRIRLSVVGDGPSRAMLEAQAQRLGLNGACRFLGFQSDIGASLTQADALVLPSRREGLPMALLEALAAGRPVVATPVGGIPDLVQDGVNGLLVPPDDVAALAKALQRLPGEIAGLRARASAAAPALREELGPERWAKRLLETYRAGINDKEVGVWIG